MIIPFLCVQDIRYVESSMKSGFGLKLLHKFLNLPYLCLQRQALQTQMEINAQEIEATKLELELYLESDEADYDLYLEGVTQVGQPAQFVFKQFFSNFLISKLYVRFRIFLISHRRRNVCNEMAHTNFDTT